MEEHNRQVIEKYVSFSQEMLVAIRNLECIFDTINSDAVCWKGMRKLTHWKKNTGHTVLLALYPLVNGYLVSHIRDALENIMFNEFEGNTNSYLIGGVRPLHVFYGCWGSDTNEVIKPFTSTVVVKNPTHPSLADISEAIKNVKVIVARGEYALKQCKTDKFKYARHLRSDSTLRKEIAKFRKCMNRLIKLQREEAVRVISRFVSQRTLPTGSIDNLLYRPPDGLMVRRSCREIESLTNTKVSQ